MAALEAETEGLKGELKALKVGAFNREGKGPFFWGVLRLGAVCIGAWSISRAGLLSLPVRTSRSRGSRSRGDLDRSRSRGAWRA